MLRKRQLHHDPAAGCMFRYLPYLATQFVIFYFFRQSIEPKINAEQFRRFFLLLQEAHGTCVVPNQKRREECLWFGKRLQPLHYFARDLSAVNNHVLFFIVCTILLLASLFVVSF